MKNSKLLETLMENLQESRSLDLYDSCYKTNDREELKEIALNAIYVANDDVTIINELLNRLTEEEKIENLQDLQQFKKAPYDYIANNYNNIPLELLREIALNAVYVANDDEAIQKEIDNRKIEESKEETYYYEIHFDYTKDSGKDSDGYSKFFKSKKAVPNETAYVIDLALDENILDDDDKADIEYIDYAQQIDEIDYRDATGEKIEEEKYAGEYDEEEIAKEMELARQLYGVDDDCEYTPPIQEYKYLDAELDKLLAANATDKELNDFLYIVSFNEMITDKEYKALVKKAQDVRRIEVKEEDCTQAGAIAGPVGMFGVKQKDKKEEAEEIVYNNRMSFRDFKTFMMNADKEGKEVSGVIVFTEDSFDKPYSLQQRSYRVSNTTSRGLQNGKISNSIWGDCLDGTDKGVRLDWYIGDGWKVDYCYVLDNNKEIKTEDNTNTKNKGANKISNDRMLDLIYEMFFWIEEIADKDDIGSILHSIGVSKDEFTGNKDISEDRILEVLHNTIEYISEYASHDEEENIFRNSIGFTDEEMKELGMEFYNEIIEEAKQQYTLDNIDNTIKEESKEDITTVFTELDVHTFEDLREEVDRLFEEEVFNEEYEDILDIISEQEDKCVDYISRRSEVTNTDYEDELDIEDSDVQATIKKISKLFSKKKQ